ncbi:MAG: alkaline phosphatase family protein, partial [Fimbriiglobus sp.]|nr:alkaline phosphatase family protein [Fimbriiglobus sp.]
MPKFVRVALALLPTAAFVVVAAVYLPAHWNDRPTDAPAAASDRQAPANPGRLVVVMVFDQLRGDFPVRWREQLDLGGFSGMERDGVWYADTHLPYSCTSTAPGHASIGTGQLPSVHGIIENEWFDRKRGGKVQNITPERPSARVPTRTDGNTDGFAPDQLLIDGLGDHLKRAKPDSRVFSLALKDRAAVMMGGKKPDGVYAFDTDVGRFHTAARYRDTPHPWAEEFNDTGAADAWFKKEWERRKPAAVYDAAVGPDDAPGETRYEKDGKTGGRVGYGSTFPHPLNIDGRTEPTKRYYERLEASPFGNELLWEFARKCITVERLGTNGRADLLFLGFSANDVIGHKWGPDSHEVLDCTIRTDELIRQAREWLDAHVGVGRWSLIVTADHGVCPFPERTTASNPEAERFDPRPELDPAWFADGGRYHLPHIHLNHAAIEAQGLKVLDVAAAVAKWAANRPHVEAAFTRTELLAKPSADPLISRCQYGYHSGRGGDVYVVTKAFCVPMGIASLGTTHGSPHSYDTHVPLYAVGAGV